MKLSIGQLGISVLRFFFRTLGVRFPDASLSQSCIISRSLTIIRVSEIPAISRFARIRISHTSHQSLVSRAPCHHFPLAARKTAP